METFIKKSLLLKLVFLLVFCTSEVLGKRSRLSPRKVEAEEVVSQNDVSNLNGISETKTDRNGRLFQFLALVNIAQGLCKTDDGSSGVCMKKSACTTMMGIDLGKCAQGFGTCCQISKKCGNDLGVVSTNGTRLVQGSEFRDLCRYEIPRQPGVCQIRLDFTKFQIAEGPLTQHTGACDADTLTVSGHANAMLGDLCGNLDGQHMYLDYGTNNKINLDIYMMSEMGQNWDIMVTMIKCDSLEKAPSGCLQYFTDQRGTVKSFNYNNGHQLNNQDYSICVRTNPAMKKIAWRSCAGENTFVVSEVLIANPSLSLTGDACNRDWVTVFGTNKYCGTAFPEVVETRSQPFLLGVHFNEVELIFPPDPANPDCPTCDEMNTGFCLMYAQTPN